MALLPKDLAQRLVEDSLPWDQATKLHVSAFLQNYTLHDSLWITLHVNCGWENQAIAVIGFDPIWNTSVASPEERTAEWPILFLRFSCVGEIALKNFINMGGIQRGISDAAVEQSFEEEVVLKITDHYGASIHIRHFPLIDALVVGNDGRVKKLDANTPQLYRRKADPSTGSG